MIFKELNINGYYHLFEIDKNNLKEAASGLNVLGVRGVNVTIPYKVKIIKHLHNLSNEAVKIGAVNTIAFDNDKMIGYNTDYSGFGMLLNKNNISINNETIFILGTGGASRAVSEYLVDNNAKDIIVVSRDIDIGKQKYPDFNVIQYSDLNNIKVSGIVINCTPVGMYPQIEFSPIGKHNTVKFHTVVDLIYNPNETKLLKDAKEEGLKVINGLYMLIGQAVKAQEIWNNINISDTITEGVYKKVKKVYNWR